MYPVFLLWFVIHPQSIGPRPHYRLEFTLCLRCLLARGKRNTEEGHPVTLVFCIINLLCTKKRNLMGVEYG